ncbi:chemotaxis protein MotB [Thiogranum longum]|uniref:Chemotaxis protein MotB n=1 Tax=Thiogranum longum TaxID=1537524 RepID=A0A4R1HDN0_9GAMM|nr:flagellar motor protein MotD [Thiogranum longum]TCK18821.1 chemotaxis protein MotB [Thiogranum longum]
MARRKRVEEHENHDRWLVSYADFITLLFAFFVVMYSISSVNEGKYRVLSDSMVAAFADPTRSMEPVQIGDLMRSPIQSENPLNRNKPVIELFRLPLPERDIRERLDKKLKEEREKAAHEAEEKAARQEKEIDAASEALADSIEQAMSELMDNGLIDVRRDKRWIEVEIKSSILFGSGSAELAAGAQPVLRKLAEKLAPLNNTIHVEGFTDNVPIDNFEFRSNWELSAARAASVVHLFTRLGVSPERMAAIGYGEYRPIASNDTPEGRSRNRRVVLVIMSGADPRVSQSVEHLQTERDATRPVTATGAGP